MSTYYKAPASVESQHAKLFFRKLTPQFPVRKHKKLGKLFRFKLEIDGKAYVYKELTPKRAILNPKSHLNKNDGVEANTLAVLTSKAIKKTDPKLSKGSSKHSIQFFIHKNFTFAKIEKQYPTVPSI